LRRRTGGRASSEVGIASLFLLRVQLVGTASAASPYVPRYCHATFGSIGNVRAVAWRVIDDKLVSDQQVSQQAYYVSKAAINIRETFTDVLNPISH
jgi:hypothetical protein